MKPQARPFTVEVKSKRRPLQASHTNWSTVIDEPSTDDLPSRDVGEDAADTPFAAASRVFSAFVSSAISTPSTLGELAANVFTPKPQEQPAEQTASDEGRTGRILTSLLPVNRFEVASGEEDGPVRKAAKAKRPRKRAVAVAEHAPKPTHVAADPAITVTIASELSLAAAPSPRHVRKPNRRGANARVRAGERWKRRRLPKACW
jgi:hypothetical protein